MRRFDASRDQLIRRLIRSVEPDLRLLIGGNAGLCLVGDLYLRLGEALDRVDDPFDAQARGRLLDDIALNIYLATTTESSRAQPVPELLARLRNHLDEALDTSASIADSRAVPGKRR